MSQLSTLVGAQPDELAERIDTMMTRLRAAEKEIEKLRQGQLLGQIDSILEAGKERGAYKLYTAKLGEVASGDDVRKVAQAVIERVGEGQAAVAVIVGVLNGRTSVVAATNDAARKAGAHAGKLIQTASKVLGGGGGGKDRLAQGGGGDAAKIDEAFAVIEGALAS